LQDPNPRREASQELQGLKATTDQLALPLLHQLEAYLALLRQQLPSQVLQAVFWLATQDCPERYSSLSRAERRNLQRNLQNLTRHGCCLLTVEQLVVLGRQIQMEHQQRKQEGRRKMLAALERLNGGDQEHSSGNGLLLSIQEQFEEENALSLITPRDPQGLERWFFWLNQAMVRQLRTLSNGLNGELLNHNLIQALLPIRLLDAVLTGEVEALGAPVNLLKIAVPVGDEDNAPQVVTCVLLLRLQDMEFAHLPLRLNRQKLQKYQKQLQQLVKQSRHWQKRLVSEQAIANWNRDVQQDQPQQP